MAKTTSQLIFDQNKSIILNTIRDKGPISRVDLTKRTGISAPTVTRIVSSLINSSLVRNVGIGTSSGGRPPVILEFDSTSCYVIGIEWGLTHIKGIAANLNGEIIIEKSNPYNLSTEIDKDIRSVIELIKELQSKVELPLDRLKGIGISAAGYINKKTGTIEFSPVQKWHNVNIKEPIQDAFNVPIFIDHQSRVLALNEYLYGESNDMKDILFINVDYGLGAGLLINGEIFQGFDGFSGELGHLYTNPPINYEERLCMCGKKNCLAEFVSSRGIIKTLQNHLTENSTSSIYELYKTNPTLITVKIIDEYAMNGDKVCIDILTEAGKLLGISIANITNIFNPEAVILGGKLMSSNFYFSVIKDYFMTHGLKGTSREIKFLKSKLIDHAAVKGAAALVLQSILNFS
ncbi:MAG: ROK family transcriptional regulator [Spirochaetaceae bacterium]